MSDRDGTSEVEEEGPGAEARAKESSRAKLLPLNSQRLTAAYLRQLAGGLGLPTSGSANQLRQVVEGKLQEEHDPLNVQVMVEEISAIGVKLSLVDEEGVFLVTEPAEKEGETGSSALEDMLAESERKNEDLLVQLTAVQDELAAEQEKSARLQEELSSATHAEEVSRLKQDLRKERDKAKQAWGMSCRQAAEQEDLLASKDRQIQELRQKLAESRHSRTPSESDGEPPAVEPTPLRRQPMKRRGKAPPIDQFTGENPEVRFEDWFPSLRRASRWNGWSDEELLIQLAGHLRGRALQEWDLLPDSKKGTVGEATKALSDILGPGSRVLATQDFRHASQEAGETVSTFVRRLERTFRIAYGAENLSTETRDALLYAQLQDGLRHDLLCSPNVAGALTYRELTMAAKNEERRQSEMRKRQQYQNPSKPQVSSTVTPQKPPSGRPNTARQPPVLSGPCFNCGRPGHLARDCRRPKTESTGNRARFEKSQNLPKANAKQVITDTVDAESDLMSYLHASSSDSEQDIRLVRVSDKGSSPKCAKVLVQGVPTYGIIDSGADITIMGGELFKTVASVCRIKKRDFKKPDKLPRGYDYRAFSLNGKLELDITFGETTMRTPIYVKMDAHDQLLLSEGVCRQLGMISYHPDVKPWARIRSKPAPSVMGEESPTSSASPDGECEEARVPVVQVMLLQSLRIPPQSAVNVQVRLDGDRPVGTTMLMEPNPDLAATGLQVNEALINPGDDGIAVMRVSNPSGFTHRMEQDLVLGVAAEATADIGNDDPSEQDTQEELLCRTVCSDVNREVSGEEWRKEKLKAMFVDDIDLPTPEKETFCQLIMDHHEAFCLSETERGETDLLEMEIDTGEACPKKQRPRRMPFAVRQEVSKQLRKMQETGVIRPSKSPWASPVVLVRKKDGSHRFCIDYRELNSVTKPDTFPLPRIEDLLDQLGQARYFSTLDLSSGFWQVRIHPDSREKTAFTVPQGLFEFTVMPFGLTNAPGVFQRLMQRVLMGLNPGDGPDFVSAYIDDVLIFSRTLEDHMRHLKMVMMRVIETGLKLKPVKCQFFRQEVDYLGHKITPQGLRTSNKHVVAVQEFPTPTNLKEVRRFLGMASYYRRFIPLFAKVAQPLHALTRKDIPFEWTPQCREAFESLKMKLISAPVLSYPKFDSPFVVETDASIEGLGAVMSQQQADGKLHPVAYASRGLTPGERNYGITDLETLAVVWALSHFQSYLYGQKVTVYTDHSAVRSVLQNPNANGKHARWWTKVYGSGIADLSIIYRPGKDNASADALSRCPQSPAPVIGEAETEVQVSVVIGGGIESIGELLQLQPNNTLSNPKSFAREQRRDRKVTDIISFLERGELPEDEKRARKIALQSSSFELEDEVLYFLDARRHYQKRAVVPDHLKEKVMKETHSGPFSGHFSGNRLYNVLVRMWWWDGMYNDAVSHCKNCPECAIVTGAGRPGRPPLQPIPVSRAFQIIGVDVMDLPKTDRGNKHVLVFQDFLTKWPMVFPIPDQKTDRIVKLLVEEVVPLFGVPEALLSDRGTNLLSHLMMDVCSLLGIEKLNTTAYHPQCDGLTERFNRTLKTMLRKHAATYGVQWDQHLAGLLWAYRNTPHEATGEKPSFLLFGFDCRTPTEAALLPPRDTQAVEVTDYRKQLVQTLSKARKLAADNIQRAQRRYKKQYDRHAKPMPYQVGDWVLIRFPQEESGANRKLSRPWHGPYRVESVSPTGVVAVKVYFPQDGSIQVHAHRVTMCPPEFPAGFYWYGSRRRGPGRPPKWVDRMMSSQGATDHDASTEEADKDVDEREDSDTDAEESDNPGEEPDSVAIPTQTTRTRTRVVTPPDRYM